MFKLIASDLREFVSSVKDDTVAAVNTVKHDAVGALDKLDETMGRPVLSEAQREAQFRMAIREVYSTGLPSADASPSNAKEEEAATELETKIREFEATEIALFIGSFDVCEKTDEISSLLQQNKKLRELFEELVPIEVSYEEFWRRHFYRCDPDRIQRAWDVYESLGGDKSSIALSVISGVMSAPMRLALQPIAALRKIGATNTNASTKPQITADTKVAEEPSKLLRDAQKEVEIMQSALGISNNRITALRFSVDELKNELKATKGANAELSVEVALLKKQLQQKNESIHDLEDQFLLKIDGSRNDIPSPSFALNKTSRRQLDSSGRTDTTESSLSESTVDQHIGTCVVLPADVPAPAKRSMLWNLATFGAWNASESESTIPDGWGSDDDEDQMMHDGHALGVESA